MCNKMALAEIKNNQSYCSSLVLLFFFFDTIFLSDETSSFGEMARIH